MIQSVRYHDVVSLSNEIILSLQSSQQVATTISCFVLCTNRLPLDYRLAQRSAIKKNSHQLKFERHDALQSSQQQRLDEAATSRKQQG